MSTKMNAEMQKRVKALGINAKTEEEARKGIINILEKDGCSGMDDEDFDYILSVAEALVGDTDASDSKEDESEIQSEISEGEALAKEIEDELDEEVEQAKAVNADEFDGMDRTALKAYIKANGLDITVKKSWLDDDIRVQIRAAISVKAEEVEEEEIEEVAPTPAEKAVKKNEKQAVKKNEKQAVKKPSNKGQKLNPKTIIDDQKILVDALSEEFPLEDFAYAWVANSGVTLKYKGKNSQKAVLLIENCYLQEDGDIKCNAYFTTLKSNDNVLDKNEIDYETCWSGAPFIKGILFSEVFNILTNVKDELLSGIKKSDKKLGDNRAKMEENLKSTKKSK